MIANEGLAWPFTAWFAVLAIVAAVGVFRARNAIDRLSYVAHVIMLVAMALMPWHWFMTVPDPIWIALFGLIALGYTALALRQPGRAALLGAGVSAGAGVGARMTVGTGGSTHAGRFDAWYHVTMMLGMVWMVVLMAEMHAAAMRGVVAAGGAPLAFDMSGGQRHVHGAAAMSAPGTVEIPPLWDLPLWMTGLTYVFAAVFVLATVRYLARLRLARPGTPGGAALPARVELVLGAATAAGMGVSYFVMS